MTARKKATIRRRDGAVEKAPARAAASEHAFEAARRSGYRGFFWFPTLDPSEQMPRMTRQTVAEKINWLYNNVDAVRVAVDGMTLEEVDTGIWPKAVTESPEFNRAATELFHNECSDPRFFHAAARENYYSAQWLIRRSIMLHGELFGQKIAGGVPRMHFVQPWRIGNAVTKLDQSKWTDGVMLDRLGRALQYRVRTNSDGSQWTDVPAEDIEHYHDKFWTGQARGLSGLAPVVRKLFSLDDIERAETSGVLLRTRLAYAIERRDAADGGDFSLIPGVTEVEEIANDDGTTTIVQKLVARDGSEVDVADVPAGRTLKVIESQKAAGTVDFLKWLLQGVAHCTLYPQEYVFDIAGLGQGTVARMVQKRVQRIKNTVRQFQLIPQFCSDYYRFWLWQKIKAGAFDGVPGGVPKDWWRVRHICPADDSVDIAREGRLYDERLSTGKMSPEIYHGMLGEDAEDVEDEIIAARIRRLKKLAAAAQQHPEFAGELEYCKVFGSIETVGETNTEEDE